VQPQKVNILGVGVSAINMSMALDIIDGWIKRRECNFVCVRDVHGIMRCQEDEELRQIHDQAGLVTPDGMPLAWISRLRGFRYVDRVCGPDLMPAICERSPGHGYRHFFYGGGDGVAELLKEKLQVRFPGLDVVGTYSPPFRPLTEEEDEEIVRRINALRPDIVWIGLSTPKQERWMAAHLGRIGASVMIGVGAAFDFHAGLKNQAPYWIQRSGLEWLFRLASEPRRLWYRYVILVPKFLVMLIGNALGLNRRSEIRPHGRT
jgi:N-acetylglucosaminyldiphosphoundecaprenol N-acetyl-beta-D-mannosaminyltransferase